ncbi:hypothetical protein MMC30_009288 [Trapelia coarctata]|nr:hypothetical protein [Trapelia coarctata]
MSTTTKPQKPFSIAVAGGGIGGLALAIGLIHQGVPVHIYEAAHAFAEIGAGVAFGANSMRAIQAETWFDFRYGMDSRNGNGKKAGDLICAVTTPTEPAQSSVHRAHFLDELVKLVPDECASFGKRVDKVEETDEGVRLRFHYGSSAVHTAVVGCDGIKSRTRKIVLGEGKPESGPTFTGKYAYRGLIPMEKAVGLLGEEFARNGQMYLGYHGHVLTFPIEQGSTMNVVAFRTKVDGKWDDEHWVKPMSMQDMLEDFKDWGESVQEIVSLMEKPDVWALFNHLPADTYYRKGKICLLGDSAHASTPHQGAGAGMALEDAFIMSRLMGDTEPRTQKLVTTSKEAGEIYEFEKLGDDVEKITENLQKRYRWVWEEDLDAQLEKAQGSLREAQRKL